MTEPLAFTSPSRAEAPRTPFELDGERLIAIKPKLATLIYLIREMGGENNADDMALVEGFLEQAMEPDSAKRIRERLADPEDGFDVDVLNQILNALQEVWYSDRPTGQANGSSSRRSTRRRGAGSTANVRSVG